MEEQKFTKIPEVKEKKPYILMENNVGIHNSDLEATRTRLLKGNSYKDLSTIIIVPTRGMIPAPWVQAYGALMKAMNSKCTTLFCSGDEVGISYINAINIILDNKELSSWKYILTYEDDVIPPPDGLLKLYEHIGNYNALSAAYFSKGISGNFQAYGNPNVHPKNFLPQVPIPDSITEVNALGMGFVLMPLSNFSKMREAMNTTVYFKTVQEWNPNEGSKMLTQDIYFYEQGGKLGFRYAVDTHIKCAHFDSNENIYW